MWLTFKMVKTYCRGSRSRRDVTVDVSTSVHVPSPAAVVLQQQACKCEASRLLSLRWSSPSASAFASVPHASAGSRGGSRRSDSATAMGSVPTEQSTVLWHGCMGSTLGFSAYVRTVDGHGMNHVLFCFVDCFISFFLGLCLAPKNFQNFSSHQNFRQIYKILNMVLKNN